MHPAPRWQLGCPHPPTAGVSPSLEPPRVSCAAEVDPLVPPDRLYLGVAAKAVGGMPFHDLRHAYAIWLVTDGVPINLVQRVMGHEQASTTLNRYSHTPADYAARILDAFALPADDLLTSAAEPPGESLSDDLGEWP